MSTTVQRINGPNCSYHCCVYVKPVYCSWCTASKTGIKMKKRFNTFDQSSDSWVCLACFTKNEPLLSVDQILEFPQLSKQDQSTLMASLSNDKMMNELYNHVDQHKLLSPSIIQQRRTIVDSLLVDCMPRDLIRLIEPLCHDYVTLIPGMHLLCLDTRKTWLDATILQVTDSHIYVHYDEWSDTWNEWIEYYPTNLRIQWTKGIKRCTIPS